MSSSNSARPLRVAMIGDYPQSPDKIAGGVEAVSRYLVQALQQYDDLEMHVLTLTGRNAAPRTTRHDRATVHYVPSSSAPSRLSIWRNRRSLRRVVHEVQPDLVHAHVAGMYADVARVSGLPWVLTLHGIRFLEAEIRPGFRNRTYRKWLIRREEFRAVKSASHVISISPFIQDTFGTEVRGKVYSIENPISESFFELPRDVLDPRSILFCGRMIPRKGVHTVIDAFARLHQKQPHLHLRLAGGGITGPEPTSYFGTVLKTVEQAGLAEHVHFLGELGEKEILDEYARCAVFVLSSVLETAPMVILQAMAAGKPVVTTDAGGSRHLVEDGKSGLVVPIGNADALAEALDQVFRDKERMEAMAARSRELAEQRFRNRVVAARTRSVYYEALGRTPIPESTTAV